jgi:peptidyl-prolyl cis-trans isomerase A (cyclophilin A)
MKNRLFSHSGPVVVLLLMLAGQNASRADDPVAVLMKTSAGDIEMEIYTDAAPLTATNFLNYVDAGHYDNKAVFYRTVRMDNQVQNDIKIEVIQGGFQSEADEPPFAMIAHETTQTTGIRHLDGVISMARSDPGTASSEFFICINDQPALDFGGQRNPDGLGFAAFGKVVRGMDVVRAIQAMETVQPEGQELEYTSGQMLVEPVKIHEVSRIE